MPAPRLVIEPETIAQFCRMWNVVELSLFGSVLREDFGPESDVDVLVTFAAGADWTLLDLARAKAELEGMLGRSVDLIEGPVLERHHNPWLRGEILGQSHTIYRAA